MSKEFNPERRSFLRDASLITAGTALAVTGVIKEKQLTENYNKIKKQIDTPLARAILNSISIKPTIILSPEQQSTICNENPSQALRLSYEMLTATNQPIDDNTKKYEDYKEIASTVCNYNTPNNTETLNAANEVINTNIINNKIKERVDNEYNKKLGMVDIFNKVVLTTGILSLAAGLFSRFTERKNRIAIDDTSGQNNLADTLEPQEQDIKVIAK